MPESDDGQVVGQSSKELRVVATLGEEFKQVLQVAGASPLEKPLCVACCLGVPFEHRLLISRQMAIERGDERLPLPDNQWLVQKAVDDEGVVPV